MLATYHSLSRTGQVTWGVKGLGGYVYAMAVRSSSPYSVAIGCGDRSIRVLDPSSPDVRRASVPRTCVPACQAAATSSTLASCSPSRVSRRSPGSTRGRDMR